MSEPEIALLLSTYQRPNHLRRALESIALQQGVAGRMELVVTDDGSTDETRKIDITSRFYRLIHHPRKPKLFGNNVGIWRADFERVNGFDENFQGWGCEDDDLRHRLRKAGVYVESILRWTRSYHLWHPIDAS